MEKKKKEGVGFYEGGGGHSRVEKLVQKRKEREPSTFSTKVRKLIELHGLSA